MGAEGSIESRITAP